MLIMNIALRFFVSGDKEQTIVETFSRKNQKSKNFNECRENLPQNLRETLLGIF